MPDFAVSQANASAQFDRWCQAGVRPAAFLKDVRDLFQLNTAQVIQDGGWLAGVRQITQWSLSGVNASNSGRNVTDGALLWVRITANAGNWDIHVYMALAAASEVMTATNVAAGATITFSAANSSGMTGTAVLGASPAAIAADTYSLRVFLGYPQMIRQIFDGTQQEDGGIAGELLRLVGEMGTRLDNMVKTFAAKAESDAANGSPTGGLQTQLGRIWRIPGNIPFLSKVGANDDGTVTVTVDGTFERLRKNWGDNTTIQKIPVSTIAAGAASYSATNQGNSTATVGTPGENLEPGTLQFVCTNDAPNYDDIRFSATFTPTDGTGPIFGSNELTVGKAWDDPNIPVSVSLAFSYLLSADDGDGTDVAAVGLITGMTGLTSSNSDGGKLYGYVRVSGSTYSYEFYSSSGYTAASLVAKSPYVAAATAFTAVSQNQSGVQVGWKSGSAPADADLFTINIRPHKKGDSTHSPDQFTIAITRSAKGWIQDQVRENHGWKLNSGGSPTFADTFGQRCALLFNGGL